MKVRIARDSVLPNPSPEDGGRTWVEKAKRIQKAVSYQGTSSEDWVDSIEGLRIAGDGALSSPSSENGNRKWIDEAEIIRQALSCQPPSSSEWSDAEWWPGVSEEGIPSKSPSEDNRAWIDEAERIRRTAPSAFSPTPSSSGDLSLDDAAILGPNGIQSGRAIKSDTESGYTTGPQAMIPRLNTGWQQKWQPGDSSPEPTSPLTPISLSSESHSEQDDGTYAPPRPSIRRTPSVPPAQPPSVNLEPSELYRNDPRVWSAMAEELDALQDGRWIGSHILDAWLFLTWTSFAQDGGRRPMRFIRAAQLESSTKGQPSPAEVQEFRRQYSDLPQSGPCKLEDVAYVYHTGSHYFVVLFMPAEGFIHILGQFITGGTHDCGLESWNGGNIWKTVMAYFGWKKGHMKVKRTNWVQNGYDCGPTSAQVLEWIWTKGFHCSAKGEWVYPNDRLPCCHGLRRSMALMAHRLVRRGVDGFFRSLDTNMTQLIDLYGKETVDACKMLANEASEECTTGIDRKVREVVGNLELAISKCRKCSIGEDASQINKRTAPGASQEGLIPSPLFLPAVSLKKDASAMSRGEEGLGGLFETGGSLNSVQKIFRYETPMDKSTYLGNRYPTSTFVAKDWSQAVIGRFPRPSGPDLPSVVSRIGLHHATRNDYDDYVNGPTRDILDPLPLSVLGLGGLSLAYIANRIMTTPWTVYKDYGYRLLPTFCQVAYLGKPVMVKDHLCPSGPLFIPQQFPDINISRSGAPVETNDLCTVGPEEMLELAKKQGRKIMVTGRLDDGRYLRVDLQKEAQTPQKLDVAVDIDSIVWITRIPRFSGSLALLLMPAIRDRPPLWKNNHIQVELLYPQTAEDKEGQGPRSDWDTRTLPLSRIPHMLIATIAQVTSTVEVLLFFPRMTHFHPHSHRWQNSVPTYLQKVFWDQLIYPNLYKVIPKEQLQFYGNDRSHSAFKRGGAGKLSTHPVSSDTFESLMAQIGEQIKHDLKGTHNHFGSFFFVVQVKGCKGLTQTLGKALDTALTDSLSKFAHSFPSLDWHYMRDRTKGELVCDVGITIHPSSEDNLVGLWKLDRLEASYGAGGYLSGNLHTLNTLSNYGGLQAPMPDKRRNQTHLVFRSSYNLPYEAIRKHDNSRNLFDEIKVFHRDSAFIAELSQVLSIYDSKADGKSYGVRDEFRVAGSALEDIETCLGPSVRELVACRPMIWLKASTWFAFLAARLRALDDIHQEISYINPPNVGVLTGIIAYMMQSVLFTPPIVQGFVREALASLQYTRHCNIFGMFFLDGYDINTRGIVPGILQKDSGTVIRYMGPRKFRPGRNHAPRAALDDEADLFGLNNREDYPLGPNPSMEQISEALRRDPASILSSWQWPRELERYLGAEEGSLLSSAAAVFVDFTHIAWYTLAETSPNVTTLKDALKSWSLLEVLDKVGDASIRPTLKETSGKARREMDMRGFSTKRKFFFPNAEEPLRSGRWKAHYQLGGYIHHYRRVLTDIGPDDAEEFGSYIDELLEHCQCLPEVTPGGKRKPDMWARANRQVLISANPKYLRIAAVGPKGRRLGPSRGAAVQRSAWEITTEVLRRSGVNEEAAKEAMRLKQGAIRDRRSGKSKNKRKPPASRAAKKANNSSTDSEY